jgi:prepilin-type N-terminal cleavage/methylation domain-containing protein
MSGKAGKISRNGFTLIELLISLAIMGMLLVALAVALNASVINYRENEEIYRGINEARQALIRMTSQIRTGLVDPNNITDEQVCEVLCSDGNRVQYHYDSGNNRLYLYDYNTSSDYLLCDNATSVIFKKDNNTTTGDVKSVRISLTVSDGKIEQKLAAAAVVRKVLEH